MFFSTILTPPLPKLDNLIAAWEKIQQYKTNFSLPKITPLSGSSVVFTKSSPAPTQSSSIASGGTSKNNSINIPYPSITVKSTTGGPSPTTKQPTPTFQPTKTPKPTKPPKPTPTPTIKLQALRPGKNFQDAADIIQPIICIPSAMIMATLDNEYGPWMAGVEADWVNKNTYHGSDPHNNPGSTKVVSVMQMMEDTWSRIKPIVSQKFGGAEMSISVTFDAMAAGGYHLRNISLAMQDKISCDDWPVKYILYGACRYNGACAAGATTYNQYAYDVCNAYNRYTPGPKKNCQ